MQIAQRLYEGVEINGEVTGLITYMRTDGIDIAPEAVTEIRDTISSDFGGDYLPDAPRRYTKKAANAQKRTGHSPTSVNACPPTSPALWVQMN